MCQPATQLPRVASTRSDALSGITRTTAARTAFYSRTARFQQSPSRRRLDRRLRRKQCRTDCRCLRSRMPSTAGFLLSGDSFASLDVSGQHRHRRARREQFRPDRGRRSRARRPAARLPALCAGSYNGPGAFPSPEVGGAANGINDAGQIAGVTGSGPNATGLLWSAGTYTRIPFPGSAYTTAWGINNLGDIVGQIDSPHAPFRGFRLAGGHTVVIDLPDFPFSWDGHGINDLGQIVGAFTGADGRTHGYLATPTALKIDPVVPRSDHATLEYARRTVAAIRN